MEGNFNEIKNQLREEIKQRQVELEGEKEKFIEITGSFCTHWIVDYARREAIHDRPEITEMLGAKLKDFKNEVQILAKRAPELIKKEFAKKEYWKHYETSDQISKDQQSDYFNNNYYKYKFTGNRQPEILDNGIRMVIGQLGIILEKYNYSNPEKNSLDRWEKEGIPYYRYGFDWSQKMKEVSEIYAEKLKKFQELNHKLKGTIKEEKQFKAQKNWDSLN